MTAPRDDYWFPRKRCGWGWGPPRRWQGWVVVLLYLAVVFGGIVRVQVPYGDGPFIVLLLGATGALLAICAWKGEPPGGPGR